VKGDFFLIAVDADPEIRFQRISERKSETDHISYETFISNEAREMNTADPNKQNLKACIRVADFVMNNNGTKEELFGEVEKVLEKIT
jgi:dephospho-CoA kinase